MILFAKIDSLAARVIPNANARAIIYLTVVFGIALWLQLNRIV